MDLSDIVNRAEQRAEFLLRPEIEITADELNRTLHGGNSGADCGCAAAVKRADFEDASGPEKLHGREQMQRFAFLEPAGDGWEPEVRRDGWGCGAHWFRLKRSRMQISDDGANALPQFRVVKEARARGDGKILRNADG